MPDLRPFMLWSQGQWPVRDVVGESFREKEIRSLFPAARRVTYQDSIETTARLVPETDNPHDRHAVAVLVGSTHVGYLAKDEAVRYQPVLLNLRRSGFEAVVPCTVSGDEYEVEEEIRRGRWARRLKFHPNVRVVLDESYRCVPVNPPPPDPWTMLPVGAALQAQKEEEHQDVLRRYLNANGECWAYATLHEVIAGPPKAAKPTIEIRIDGARVGQLTPAMSAHFLPTVSALGQRGRATAAQVVVKGNALKVEVVLYAARAHDIDAAWVQQHVGTVSTTPAVPTFNPAPGWPRPAAGWVPPPGWQPHPDWPPAPPGWRFWI